MPTKDAWAEYQRILGVLRSGSAAEFEQLAITVPDFPHGKDYLERHWIRTAIDCGSKESIEWMLGRQVNLTFRDDEGYTVLHSAIDRKAPDKHNVLALLLRAGAPRDAHGINEWTPAHMAAVRDDVEALEVLRRHGANLSAVRIDDLPRTPLQDAASAKKENAVAYLKKWA